MDTSVKTTLKKMKQVQHEINLSRRLLANSYNIDEIENIEADIRKKVITLFKIYNFDNLLLCLTLSFFKATHLRQIDC